VAPSRTWAVQSLGQLGLKDNNSSNKRINTDDAKARGLLCETLCKLWNNPTLLFSTVMKI